MGDMRKHRPARQWIRRFLGTYAVVGLESFSPEQHIHVPLMWCMLDGIHYQIDAVLYFGTYAMSHCGLPCGRPRTLLHSISSLCDVPVGRGSKSNSAATFIQMNVEKNAIIVRPLWKLCSRPLRDNLKVIIVKIITLL